MSAPLSCKSRYDQHGVESGQGAKDIQDNSWSQLMWLFKCFSGYSTLFWGSKWTVRCMRVRLKPPEFEVIDTSYSKGSKASMAESAIG